MEMSVHVETAGLASTPASRFCIAGIGSGQLRSSVGDRRRSPYVDSGAQAVDTGGEPGDTYRRTTAQDGQSADECYVVVLSDRRYLSRRCRIPQTAHQRQHYQTLDDTGGCSVGRNVALRDLHDASPEQFSQEHRLGRQ